MSRTPTSGTNTAGTFKRVLAVVSSMSIVLSLVLVGAANPAQAATGETEVTLNLVDSNGNGLSGATVQYYGKANGSTATAWHNFGTTSGGSVSKEITPGNNITFQVTYNNTRQSKSVKISGATDAVSFQTVPIFVSLADSSGNPIQGATSAYSGIANGWHSLGKTGANGQTDPIELLQSTVSFEVQYKGGRETEQITLSGATEVDFKTKPVTLKLEDQNGNPVAGGKFEHYGLAVGGWVQHGLSGANGTIKTELLNGSYTVHMTHNKKLQKATVVVAGDSAGHTFNVEVATPVEPVKPVEPTNPGEDDTTAGDEGNQGDEGNNENPTNPGDESQGDGNVPVEDHDGVIDDGNDDGVVDETPAEVVEEDAPQETVDSDADAVAPVIAGGEDFITESNMLPNDDATSEGNNATVGTLAHTGSTALYAGLAGAMLLVGGFVLLVTSRRKS